MRTKLHLALALVAFLAFGATASDIITATITVTNTAGTTNGQTLTVNGNVRTWTNSVVIPASQILTNSLIGGAATNLFNQVSATPYTGPNLSLARTGTNGIILQAPPGGALAVTLSAGWGNVVLSTNTTGGGTVVRIPYNVEAAPQQTNVTSGIVQILNAAQVTNAIFESSASVQNLVGLTNGQTIAGIKFFTNVLGQWYGIVSNAPAISGNIWAISNGIWRAGILLNPILTNGVNYGNAFQSRGSGTASEQYGDSADASGDSSLAVGASSIASGDFSAAIGEEAAASGLNSTAIGAQAGAGNDGATAVGTGTDVTGLNATAIGGSATAANASSTAIGAASSTTADHQLMFGTSSEYAHFPGNVRIDGNTDLTWKRFPITSLANGNNAAVAVGTNTFIEVSGPSAAFTINGIANGRDGKEIQIYNGTGFDMTIAHQSGTDPTAGNRIITMTGADRTTTGNGFVTLIYSGTASRWIQKTFDP